MRQVGEGLDRAVLAAQPHPLAIEAGVVAVFGDDGAEAGIVLAIFSIGSLGGGLFLGHVPIGPWSTARRMFIVFFGTAAVQYRYEFPAVTLIVLAGVLTVATVRASAPERRPAAE